jgi:hypothetical protein
MDSRLVVNAPVKNASDAMRVLLQTSLSHMADFQVMMLEIVAETYGHSVDELIAVVKEHPRFKTMQVEPLLTDLASCAEEHSSEMEGLSDMMEDVHIASPASSAPAPAPAPAPAAVSSKGTLKSKKGNTFVIKKSG